MSERSDERPNPVPESATDYTATSRRHLLKAAAAAGGVVALGDLAAAQGVETIELGGETSGWQGVAPDDIAGETNPTLELEAGTTYELTWENLDGQPHNFVIESEGGEQLERTDLLMEQGETQTLEFEATSEMAEYYCEPHSATMRGEISVGDGGGGGAEQDEAAEEEPEAFFDPGAEIGVRTLAEGMTAPTDMAVADEDEERYFVADQTGELWVVTGDGLQDEPFLDVSDRLVELGTFEGDYADPNQDYDERGLLGVEFHPEFAENGRFFVHYSAPPNDETPEGWSHVEVVSELQATEDLSAGDPDSERVLMEFQKPQYNHDAGPMAFGPDGYLYVPMGDGGGANDNMEGHVEDWYDGNEGGNGQDVSENLLGSVLRVDVDSEMSETSRDGSGDAADEEGEDRPYAIPEDNPLVDSDEGLDEHYAWGFRNPFGISFDSDGRLFVSDAGQDLFEEANLVEAGGNYGWNVKEGTHCFSTESPSQPPEDCPDSAPDEAPYDGQELQDPIVEYPHVYQEQVVGITIIGGHVYEAGDIGDLDGKYVFGDWTADPARQSPQGRILAASEPSDGAGGMTGDGGGNQTEGMSPDDQEMPENATPDEEGIEGEGFENETNATNATNETPDDGAADVGGGGQEQVVPRDELWDMEELQLAGSEDGSFPYFVRQFGQDLDGNVYVLANQVGVPEGDTGTVFEIVPPGEGESLEPFEADEAVEPEEQETDENATEDTQNESIAENATDNESVADENVTDGENATDNETLSENVTADGA
ncbi:blue (type 1) copper domain protein [Haloterrigena turkmenica DSM 5511]|uniref:Blue (Type 1) copper domain protein n=1 Tax=Haloterrigena turkmenica (strain ATCC 51198 / DSM 5511 / JCM 9101 / NCIMB 13204 / VKM B-1734 / 4k) TaxID=543526 RepID=D2RSZ5_HALTV|nr:PQQ-dependent sugar dehydrogenase [Haloterrigena turkmenica]ADB60875.1 blue (type 1) copper domain protein [Haloterrigena turkmenica DSM 5511]